MQRIWTRAWRFRNPSTMQTSGSESEYQIKARASATPGHPSGPKPAHERLENESSWRRSELWWMGSGLTRYTNQSQDWHSSSHCGNSWVHLSSPSQNSVPLHLARHAAASTDGMFFEGKAHLRSKGTPGLCRVVAISLPECSRLGKPLDREGHSVATDDRHILHHFTGPGAEIDG